MFLLKNAVGRKFHHDYSQSEATNRGYRCDPLWRTQLGSGKVSSSNSSNSNSSSSRTSRTSSSSGSSSSSSSSSSSRRSSSSSSSSSDKTRQDKTRQDKTRQDKTRQDKTRQDKTRQGKARQGKARQGKARQGKARQGKARQGKARQGKARQLTYFRRLAIPQQYPKMEERNPSPPIPLIISTQPHLQISKGETQHNPIPNGTDTLGEFRTYRNAGKNINVPNQVFQNTSWTQHAPTSRNLSPQLNATKQVNALSFQMGCNRCSWGPLPTQAVL